MIKIRKVLWVAVSLLLTVILISNSVHAATVTTNLDLTSDNIPISVKAGDKLIVDLSIANDGVGDILYSELLVNQNVDPTEFWGFFSSKTEFAVYYNDELFIFASGTAYDSVKEYREAYSDDWIDWSVSGGIGTLEFLQDWPVEINQFYSRNGGNYTEKTGFSYGNALDRFAYYQQVRDDEEADDTGYDFNNGDYIDLENDVDPYLNDTDLLDAVKFFAEDDYMYLDDLETPIKDLNGVVNKLVFTGDLYHYVEIIDPVNNVTYSYDTIDWEVREIIFSVDGSNVLTVSFEETAGAVDETEYNVSADTYLRLSTVSEDTGSGDTGSGGVITPDDEALSFLGIEWYFWLGVGVIALWYFGFTKEGRKVLGLK